MILLLVIALLRIWLLINTKEQSKAISKNLNKALEINLKLI